MHILVKIEQTFEDISHHQALFVKLADAFL